MKKASTRAYWFVYWCRTEGKAIMVRKYPLTSLHMPFVFVVVGPPDVIGLQGSLAPAAQQTMTNAGTSSPATQWIYRVPRVEDGIESAV